MTLGKKIMVLRKKAGLSQEQLAEKLGVSRQAVTKWESNDTIPDTTNMRQLADLFGTSVDQLMSHGLSHASTVLREQIDTARYEKIGNIQERRDAVAKDMFPQATTIYQLIRQKKMNKFEAVIDFFVGAGTLEIADALRDMDAYYLVETGGKQLLVSIGKDTLEARELPSAFTDKKYSIDGSLFKKTGYTL